MRIIGVHESFATRVFSPTGTLNMDRPTATTEPRIAKQHAAGARVLHSGSAAITSSLQNQKSVAPKTRSSGRTIYCFSCNRQESHFVSAYSRFILVLAIVLSLGLYVFFGQYRCHCCSSSRLFRYDFLNPKYWYRKSQLRRDGVKKRRRRRSKRRR